MPLRLIALLLVWCCSASSHASITDAAELDPAWKLISDRNGIQVYMRHRDESRLKTFRGVTRFTLADEYALAALLEDYESYPRWLHFVDGASEFGRQSSLLRHLRFTTRLPWPLNDREAVLEARVSQTISPERESVTIYLHNRPDLLPVDNNYVRFPEMEGIFQLTRLGKDEVEVVYQLVLDPGGYIPAWLANMLLRDAPYFTLDRLRRIISRPEYQRRFYNYVELRGPGRPATLAAPRSYLYGNPPAAPLVDMTEEQGNPTR